MKARWTIQLASRSLQVATWESHPRDQNAPQRLMKQVSCTGSTSVSIDLRTTQARFRINLGHHNLGPRVEALHPERVRHDDAAAADQGCIVNEQIERPARATRYCDDVCSFVAQ